MSMDPAVARVWDLAAPVATGEGLEIVEIQFRYEGGRGGKVLRLFLDKEGGPSLDDLTRVSRQLSDLLDVHEPLEGPYTLEVSSPGINRPLAKPDHFSRFVGKRIRVRTREKIEGRRSFLGVLQGANEERIIIAQEQAEYSIPFSLIEKANYEHDWDEAR